MANYENDIVLAVEAEAFLGSPLGRRIAELAGAEVDRCLMELKTADPDDVKLVRQLQETIRRNETLGTWVIEVLHLGQQAKDILSGEE